MNVILSLARTVMHMLGPRGIRYRVESSLVSLFARMLRTRTRTGRDLQRCIDQKITLAGNKQPQAIIARFGASFRTMSHLLDRPRLVTEGKNVC